MTKTSYPDWLGTELHNHKLGIICSGSSISSSCRVIQSSWDFPIHFHGYYLLQYWPMFLDYEVTFDLSKRGRCSRCSASHIYCLLWHSLVTNTTYSLYIGMLVSWIEIMVTAYVWSHSVIYNYKYNKFYNVFKLILPKDHGRPSDRLFRILRQSFYVLSPILTSSPPRTAPPSPSLS